MKYGSIIHIAFLTFGSITICRGGVTMKQFESSLDMLRSACQPKFKIPVETLDDLRKGVFKEDPELKCYAKCIAQMVGTLSKKGEISAQRTLAQIDIMLPIELQETARQALNACKDIQNNYKDSCEKAFYTAKCAYEFSPDHFKFP